MKRYCMRVLFRVEMELAVADVSYVSSGSDNWFILLRVWLPSLSCASRASLVIVEMAPGPVYLELQSNPIWSERDTVLKGLC